jgi:transcriptional regulator with XRE-family HTH domain
MRHGEKTATGNGVPENLSLLAPLPMRGACPCIGIDVNGIGQRIREARSRRGWSQNELASRASVKQPTLQRIEAGLRQDPSIRTIAALAAALGMTIDSLVDQAAAIATPHSDASQLAFDAIEELTRHVAEVEERLEARIRALEDYHHEKKLRTAT